MAQLEYNRILQLLMWGDSCTVLPKEYLNCYKPLKKPSRRNEDDNY